MCVSEKIEDWSEENQVEWSGRGLKGLRENLQFVSTACPSNLPGFKQLYLDFQRFIFNHFCGEKRDI
jgi:hypothetical protein